MNTRPRGITALSLFFVFGATMSFTAAVSLFFPGSFLEPIWRLNPTARDSFTRLGGWSVILMFAVSSACAASAIGLWRNRRWGLVLSMIVLGINVLGDTANAILGHDLRTLVGVPIGLGLLLYLKSRVKLTPLR